MKNQHLIPRFFIKREKMVFIPFWGTIFGNMKYSHEENQRRVMGLWRDDREKPFRISHTNLKDKWDDYGGKIKTYAAVYA